MIGVDRVGGQGDSALTIQISQAGWTDVIYLSIYLSMALRRLESGAAAECVHTSSVISHRSPLHGVASHSVHMARYPAGR